MTTYSFKANASRLKGGGSARNRIVKALRGGPFFKLEGVNKAQKLWKLTSIIGREDVVGRLRKLEAIESLAIQSGDTKPAFKKRNKTSYEIEGKRPMLLVLPAEIRNSIYEFALLEKKCIEFRPGHRRPKYPGLLHANRQIRQEAIAIYYKENAFVFHIKEMNARPYIQWHKLSAHCPKDLVCFKVTPAQNWRNLFEWLEATWKDGCNGLVDTEGSFMTKDSDGHMPRSKAAAAILFELLEDMKGVEGMTWERIKKMLEQIHTVMLLQNEKWK